MTCRGALNSTNLEQAQALADQGLIGGAELVQVDPDSLSVVLNRGKLLGEHGLGACRNSVHWLDLADPSGSSVDEDSLESVSLVPSGTVSSSEVGSSSSGSTNSPVSSVSQSELSESATVDGGSSSNDTSASNHTPCVTSDT